MNRASDTWKLEDAKARFSELVRRARTQGPQLVTVRGQHAVVVVAAAAAAQLQRAPEPSLVAFLHGSHLSDLDLERAPDVGRDLDL